MDLFRKLDADASGTIDAAEFDALYKSLIEVRLFVAALLPC